MVKKFEIILGSAFWGWTLTKSEVFEVLETAVQQGLTCVDVATNYPLNGQIGDFRASEKILQEFLHAHGLSDFKVFMKIGSLSNMRSSENNLSKSFILMLAEEYRRVFGSNLHCIMLHWDNRTSENEIEESIEAMEILEQRYGLKMGLSGIKHPEIYARIEKVSNNKFYIEAKHNVFQSDLDRYAPLMKEGNEFFVYGINAGGIKLEENYSPDSTIFARNGNPEQFAEKVGKIQSQLPKWNSAFVRPPIKKMNQLGLIHAYNQPQVGGVIVGPRNSAQLIETVDFSRNLGVFDYADVSDFISKKI